MTVKLSPTQAPPGGEVVRTWLEAGSVPVRPKRKAGDPLPQRVVERIPINNNDPYVDAAMYRIHDFAATFTAAEDNARWTERRMRALAPPLTSQSAVTLDNGRVVYADLCIVTRAYSWEYYSDTIERFVADYRVELRFIAV